MAHPQKPPYRRKNLLCKPNYSHFCPKFCCHGNGGRSGKMQLAVFDGTSPKTPLYAQKSRKNLIRKPSYSQFCPKFRCHGNQGGSGVNLNDTIILTNPKNHTLEPKITILSYAQPKL